MKKMLNIKLYKENKLEKEYKEIPCIENNGTLTFFLENAKMSINENEVKRENKDFLFKIDIKKEKCSYYLKEKKMWFDIQVLEKIFFCQKENSIIIRYRIETEEEPLKTEIYWKEE